MIYIMGPINHDGLMRLMSDWDQNSWGWDAGIWNTTPIDRKVGPLELRETLGHWKHFSGSLGRGETFKGSRFLLDGYGEPKYPPFLPQTIPFFGDWLRPEVPPIVWGQS